jgi:hypothetical protein
LLEVVICDQFKAKWQKFQTFSLFSLSFVVIKKIDPSQCHPENTERNPICYKRGPYPNKPELSE